MLVIYYRDGSRQVVKPRQEAERTQGLITVKGEKAPVSKNFCGDWSGLARAVSGGDYLRYEVI